MHTELTSGMMDELGNLELDILKNFSSFSDTIEKIQNRPKFKEYNKNGIKLPKYDREELEKASSAYQQPRKRSWQPGSRKILLTEMLSAAVRQLQKEKSWMPSEGRWEQSLWMA